jgi:hypothetical protein
MDTGRLGYKRTRKQATIGDLVVCTDAARTDRHGHTRKFIGLVLDKSITVYKIQVVDTGEEIYWPESATYLWKETK